MGFGATPQITHLTQASPKGCIIKILERSSGKEGLSMKKLKNRMKIFRKSFVIACFVLIASLLAGCQNWDLVVSMGSYDVLDFEEHKDNLTQLANVCYEIYENEYKENKVAVLWIYPIPNESAFLIKYQDEQGGYHNDTFAYSKEIESALDSLYVAFASSEYGELDAIIVHEDRVSFHRPCAYSLVYTTNGKKPTFVYSEKENYKYYYVDKLSVNWYQILGKEDY